MQVVTNVGLSGGNLNVSYVDIPSAPQSRDVAKELRKYQDEKTLMRFVDHGHEVKWYLLNGNLSHLDGEHMAFQGGSGESYTGTNAQKELLYLLRDFTADDVFTRTPLAGLPKCRVNHVVNCYASEGMREQEETWQ